MKAAERYVVLLEPGCWLCRGEGGDPPRTLREDFAAHWNGRGAAEGALTRARRFRPFAHAEILPVDPRKF